MKRKLICLALSAVLSLSSCITAFAAPVLVGEDGVFDAEYYALAYPDVANDVGNDFDSLWAHYTQYGIYEGRLAFAPNTDWQSIVANPKSFLAHGLNADAELNKTYEYVTCCYQDKKKTAKTVGKLVFSNYRVSSSLPGYETPVGYEWRAVHVTILFDDENAWSSGISIAQSWEDYYNIEKWDDSATLDENGLYHMTVNYNGIDYTDCTYLAVGNGFSEWTDDNKCTWEEDVYFRVPIGYDGAVLAFRDKSITWNNGMYIYDVADANTIFFRFDKV